MTELKNTSLPRTDRYPSWLWWVCLIVASPLFVYFLCNGEHLRALIGTLSIGAVLCLAVTLRDDINTVLYWLVIAACAVFHVVLVMSIKVEWRHFPGVVFTPLVVVDLLAWQWLFASASRIVNRFAQHTEESSRT
jgi:hypothetical protein